MNSITSTTTTSVISTSPSNKTRSVSYPSASSTTTSGMNIISTSPSNKTRSVSYPSASRLFSSPERNSANTKDDSLFEISSSLSGNTSNTSTEENPSRFSEREPITSALASEYRSPSNSSSSPGISGISRNSDICVTVNTHSSTTTTSTTSVIDSYLSAPLLSPSSVTYSSLSNGSLTSPSVFPSPCIASAQNISTSSPNLAVNNDNDATPSTNELMANVGPINYPTPEHLTSTSGIPLWRKRSNSDIHDQEIDPIGLQQTMIYLVTHLDKVTSRFDELQSKVDIMQKAMFTTLDTKLGSSFQAYAGEIQTNLDKYKLQLNTDLETQLHAVVEDNKEIRRTWDSHMEGIRMRVHRVVNDDTENDDDDDDDDDSSIGSNQIENDFSIHQLNATVASLKDENFRLDCRLIEVEQYSRRESLVISGIPGNVTQRNLESTVLEIMYHMGFEKLVRDDIVACHRLHAPRNSRYPARVIVKFLNRKIVEWSLTHTENLDIVREKMGLNLQISESICAKNMEVLKMCKWLSDEGLINNYYTRNGFVKVVVEDGDDPVKIVHPEVLRKKFDGIPTFSTFS